MIAPDHEIRLLCEAGLLTPYSPELVNPASVDVRLGANVMIESAQSPALVRLNLAATHHTEADPFLLKPGQFILAETLEVLNVPASHALQFMLKSSRARQGLEHLMAGYVDPGFFGSVLTLELHNSRQLHAIPLWPGMRIGQLVCHRMTSPPTRTYALTGHYNRCLTVCATPPTAAAA